MAKRDVRQEVTDRVIRALEAGVGPWSNGRTNRAPLGVHRNGVSHHRYRGINMLLTMITAAEMGYSSTDWYTFNQVRKIEGASVRKGEKATMLTFFKKLLVKEEDPDTGEKTRKQIPLIRFYYVFNGDQIDGLPERAPRAPVSESDRDTAVELFLESITHNMLTVPGCVPGYAPMFDTINMPSIDEFTETARYYHVYFHELAHWTGTAARTGRMKEWDGFGTPAYAEEELVAEMTAAFLSAEFGLTGELKEAEYIGHWIQKLKNDNRFIFRASAEASKAMDFLMVEAGLEPEGYEETEQADDMVKALKGDS